MAHPLPFDAPAVLYQSPPRSNGSHLRVSWELHTTGVPFLRAEVHHPGGRVERVSLALADIPGLARALSLASERAEQRADAEQLRAAGRGDA